MLTGCSVGPVASPAARVRARTSTTRAAPLRRERRRHARTLSSMKSSAAATARRAAAMASTSAARSAARGGARRWRRATRISSCPASPCCANLRAISLWSPRRAALGRRPTSASAAEGRWRCHSSFGQRGGRRSTIRRRAREARDGRAGRTRSRAADGTRPVRRRVGGGWMRGCGLARVCAVAHRRTHRQRVGVCHIFRRDAQRRISELDVLRRRCGSLRRCSRREDGRRARRAGRGSESGSAVRPTRWQTRGCGGRGRRLPFGSPRTKRARLASAGMGPASVMEREGAAAGVAGGASGMERRGSVCMREPRRRRRHAAHSAGEVALGDEASSLRWRDARTRSR